MNKDKAETIGLALLKGAVGTIPLGGPIAAELMGTAIKNYRAERLEKLVVFMMNRLAHLPVTSIHQMLNDDSYVGILEKGFMAAAKATTETRIRSIGILLTNGFGDNYEYYVAEKCIDIIDRLVEVDFALFYSIALDCDNTNPMFYQSYLLDIQKRFLKNKEFAPRSQRIRFEKILDDGISRLVKEDLIYCCSNVGGAQGYIATLEYSLTQIGLLLAEYIWQVEESFNIEGRTGDIESE